MPKRDFLSLNDLSRQDVLEIFETADQLKANRYFEAPLLGKTIALIFAKSSTRTRTSFEVGISQLGGHAMFLSSRDMQLGRGEPIKDTARVMSRYVHAIMIRTYAHADAEELAAHATVPIINGLTDLLHPCQVLADVYTMKEALGGVENRVVAWVGDGNNMANSWLNAAALMGFDLRLACPEGYDPDSEILEAARSKTNVHLTRDPEEAVRDADVVNTDVWASMGQEEEAEARIAAFKGFMVDNNLMALSKDDSIFLHCLPAHRGEEVSDDVLEGPRSRVFDQAENRLHVQKALLMKLFGVDLTK